MILAFLFPIIGFILQTYTRLFNRSFGVDVWTRLIEIDHVRNAGHKIPGKLTGQFIVDGYFDYPPVFPMFFSYINRELIEKYQGVVAPFFDSLNNLLIFFVAYYFTKDIRVALLAQAIYTFIPVIVLENSSLTPRSLGYFMFNLAFISTLLYTQTHSLLLLSTSIFFTAALFLTHRFAMQSLLFVSLFFTVYQRDFYFIGVFILGLVLAVLITNGYYLRVLKGHLYNIYFWVVNKEYRYAHQVRGLSKTKKKADFVELVYSLLAKFAPITLIGTNFWIVSAFAILLVNLHLLPFLSWQTVPFINMFAAWILFLYVLGIVVLMVKYLICIGEGYRYLEMAALPSSITAAWIYWQLQQTQFAMVATIGFGLLLVGNLGLILSVHRTIIKDRNRSVTPDLENIFTFLNKKSKDYRILCIPHQNTTNVVFHTNQAVLVNADNPGLMRIQDVYPVLKFPLRNTIQKFKINLILLKESFAKKDELGLSKAKEIYRSGDVVLLEV